DIVIGHSLGEYAAACLAGVFSLEDGLKIVAARGRLMQALPQIGGMLAVFADMPTVERATHPYRTDLTIAADNGSHVVVSGSKPTLGLLATELSIVGVRTRFLDVSHAFHSHLMEPMLDGFRDVLATIK